MKYQRILLNETEYIYCILNNYIKGGGLGPELEKKRKKFIPEIKPILLDYDQEIFTRFFPKDKNVNFENLQLSNIGVYSITDPSKAQLISDIIKKYFEDKDNLIITDATANMGGNTINFAQNFKHVNAVEIIDLHCDILKNNLTEYKLEDKVSIHCGDYLDLMDTIKQDIVFFDPPWGGKDYKKINNLNLYLDEINIIDICNSLINQTKLIAIKVPFNFDIINMIKKSKFDSVTIHKIYRNENHISFYLIILK